MLHFNSQSAAKEMQKYVLNIFDLKSVTVNVINTDGVCHGTLTMHFLHVAVLHITVNNTLMVILSYWQLPNLLRS